MGFLRPSNLDLGSCMGQTDGLTDNSHQCIMPTPMEVGHKNIMTQYTAVEIEMTRKSSIRVRKRTDKLKCTYSMQLNLDQLVTMAHFTSKNNTIIITAL